jgi:hypothetical protein
MQTESKAEGPLLFCCKLLLRNPLQRDYKVSKLPRALRLGSELSARLKRRQLVCDKIVTDNALIFLKPFHYP